MTKSDREHFDRLFSHSSQFCLSYFLFSFQHPTQPSGGNGQDSLELRGGLLPGVPGPRGGREGDGGARDAQATRAGRTKSEATPQEVPGGEGQVLKPGCSIV